MHIVKALIQILESGNHNCTMYYIREILHLHVMHTTNTHKDEELSHL